MASYRRDPNVLWVEPNARRYPLLADPSDTFYNTYDTTTPDDPTLATWYKWDAHLIQCVDGWSIWPGKYYSYPGVPKSTPGVQIAIIDSGIDYSHPDFINAGASSSDSAAGGQLDKSLDVSILNGVQTALAPDEFGHGTHVTGIAAAATNNGGVGVTGNGYNATVLSIKVIDASGNGNESDIVAGIVYAADHGALIENLSLGGYSYSLAEQNAIDYAWNKGTLIVAAAGNDGTDTQPVYPGALSRVLAVSATGDADELALYSDYGDQIGIAAPGGDFDVTNGWFVDIYSTMPTYYVTLNDPNVYGATETYSYLEGTSMASPQVVGLAALYAGMQGYTQAPGVPQKLWQAIQRGSDPVGGLGWDPDYGYGRINVFNTMNLAAAPNPNDETQGCIVGTVQYKGTPVANAVISAVPVGGGSPQTASSRSDGGYRIVNASAGLYNVTATVFGASQTINSVQITAGCDIPGIDFNVGAVVVSLSALAFSPSSVAGGALTTGKITLSGPAPSGGSAVTLTSSNPAVLSVPASVTVNGTSQTFPATSHGVTTSTPVTVKATYSGLSKTTTVTVNPPALYAVSASPTSVTGGSTNATGTVTLTGLATAATTVTLTSSNPAVLSVPMSVTVNSGAKTMTFTATSHGVTTSTPVTITATLSGLSKTTTVTVNSPVLQAVSVSPSPLVGGSTNATGTVTLTGLATVATTVTLSSSNPAVMSVPMSVIVNSGAKTMTFTATSHGVTTSTPVTITATYSGLSKTATVTVNPPALYAVSATPSSVVGGAANATGTVTLTGLATAATTVTLSSSNPAVMSVPMSVTVNSGAKTMTFTATSHGVTTSTPVTITATLNGLSKTTTVTVNP